MNNFMRKAGAMALATALTVIPSASVFAATDDIIADYATKKASLTIHKYDMTAAKEDGIDTKTEFENMNDGKKHDDVETRLADYVIPGVTFTYAKVADINTYSEGGKIKLMYDIPAELQKILGLDDAAGIRNDATNKTMFTSEQLNNAIETILTTTAPDVEESKTDYTKGDLAESNFEGKNALEAYIDTVATKVTMTETNENGVTSANNLPLGLYLIVETKVPANVHTTVAPFFVSLPTTTMEGGEWFYDLNVYPKNQTNMPDLNKLVKQDDDTDAPYKDIATASEGDKVDYIFVSRLPRITSKATYLKQYDFVDQMATGFMYDRDSVEIRFYNTKADAEADRRENAVADHVWTLKDANHKFEVEFTDENGLHQMKVTPTEAGLKEIDPSLSQHWMVVSYSAQVNSDATTNLGDKGNDNQVTLTWHRSSENKDTLEDKCRVYTYGINLKKVFEGKQGVLKQTPDFNKVKFSLQNNTNGHFVTAKGANGTYYVTDGTKGAAEADGTAFTPSDNGTLVINGLEADTYILTEMQTSDGYSLLKDPIKIEIKCTETTFTPSITSLYDKKDIENIKDNNLNHFIEGTTIPASTLVNGKTAVMSSDSKKNWESANARVEMNVTNSVDFLLPQTGGKGVIAMTLAGCVAATAAVAVATRKRKVVK